MPLSTALPDSGSNRSLRASTLLFAPAFARRDREPRAGAVVAPAVRDAHDTGPDRVGDLDRDDDLARGRPHAAPARRRRHPRAPRRRGGRAACSGPCPSRARGGCASTSCSSAGRAGRRARASRSRRRSSTRAQPVDVVEADRRARARSCRSACAAPRGCAAPAARGRCRADCASSRASVRPSGSAPKPSPYGPVRSMKSRTRSGPRPRRELLEQLVGVAAFDVRPGARHRLLHEAGDHEVVERVDVGVGALAARGSPPSRSRICHSGISPGSSSTSGGE